MVRRSTWILMVVFIVLAGFAYFFQQYQAKKEDSAATATPTESKANLFDIDITQVNGIDISDSSGNQIKLFRDPATSQWAIRDIPMELTDSLQIESATSQLLSSQVQEELFQIPPLESIKLNDPDFTITISTSTGTQQFINIGTKTPIGSGYYVRLESGKVVIVDKEGLDDVLDMLTNPPLLPTPTQTTSTPASTPLETVSPTENQTEATPTP